jgi:uncharacterized protein (TIGR00251 family)
MIDIKASENGYFEILVKPNAVKTMIKSYDEKKQIYHMDVNALPTEGKANIEIKKYFRKTYKINIEIKSGLKAHKKLLKIIK